jgi:hypothetical protein
LIQGKRKALIAAFDTQCEGNARRTCNPEREKKYYYWVYEQSEADSEAFDEIAGHKKLDKKWDDEHRRVEVSEKRDVKCLPNRILDNIVVLPVDKSGYDPCDGNDRCKEFQIVGCPHGFETIQEADFFERVVLLETLLFLTGGREAGPDSPTEYRSNDTDVEDEHPSDDIQELIWDARRQNSRKKSPCDPSEYSATHKKADQSFSLSGIEDVIDQNPELSHEHHNEDIRPDKKNEGHPFEISQEKNPKSKTRQDKKNETSDDERATWYPRLNFRMKSDNKSH